MAQSCPNAFFKFILKIIQLMPKKFIGTHFLALKSMIIKLNKKLSVNQVQFELKTPRVIIMQSFSSWLWQECHQKMSGFRKKRLFLKWELEWVQWWELVQKIKFSWHFHRKSLGLSLIMMGILVVLTGVLEQSWMADFQFRKTEQAGGQTLNPQRYRFESRQEIEMKTQLKNSPALEEPWFSEWIVEKVDPTLGGDPLPQNPKARSLDYQEFQKLKALRLKVEPVINLEKESEVGVPMGVSAQELELSSEMEVKP